MTLIQYEFSKDYSVITAQSLKFNRIGKIVENSNAVLYCALFSFALLVGYI